jgi:hypothetical protein
VLRPNGLLLVQDQLLPSDSAAARYIDAFERLRDPSHHRAHSEQEWVHLFRKAGLTVVHTEQVIKEHLFLPWAERQDCSRETIQQLIGLVRRAPDAVTDWMRPRAFGRPGIGGARKAAFVSHHILVAGRSEDAP